MFSLIEKEPEMREDFSNERLLFEVIDRDGDGLMLLLLLLSRLTYAIILTASKGKGKIHACR